MGVDRLGRHFYGLEIALNRMPGARALRVIHPRLQSIEAHAHDWACLTLHALGGYTESYDGGEIRISGPAAVLHPPGGAHANRIHEEGLETVSVEFDPAWLRAAGWTLPIDRPRSWTGGPVATAAGRLAGAWSRPGASERTLSLATASFLQLALASEAAPGPAWLAMVCAQPDAGTAALARRLDLHPAWIARAYRAAVGEGLQATVRRRRVERAMALLRGSDDPAAQVAVDAGFCDQSHMHRAFRALVGRTPQQVRAERTRLGYAAAARQGD